MKLLRDVARKPPSDYDAVGTCDECDWQYSGGSERLGLIRHFDNCSDFNPEGISE